MAEAREGRAVVTATSVKPAVEGRARVTRAGAVVRAATAARVATRELVRAVPRAPAVGPADREAASVVPVVEDAAELLAVVRAAGARAAGRAPTTVLPAQQALSTTVSDVAGPGSLPRRPVSRTPRSPKE